MTQREAAAVLGVSATTLGRYETGRRHVGLPTARAMARVYGVPLAVVLTSAGTAPAVPLLIRRLTCEQLPSVLSALREASGGSLSDIARHTGSSHFTVRRWETGESVPGPHALAALELHYRLAPGSLARHRPVAGEGTTHVRRARAM